MTENIKINIFISDVDRSNSSIGIPLHDADTPSCSFFNSDSEEKLTTVLSSAVTHNPVVLAAKLIFLGRTDMRCDWWSVARTCGAARLYWCVKGDNSFRGSNGCIKLSIGCICRVINRYDSTRVETLSTCSHIHC